MRIARLFLCFSWAFSPGWSLAQPPDGTAPINTSYLLADVAGNAVTVETFAGRYQLIAFGYTSCEEVCPATLTSMGHILDLMGEKAQKVQPLFVSVDPERDQAEKLKQYLSHFDGRIIGLGGPPELVAGTLQHFHITARRSTGVDGTGYIIDHTAGLYLLGTRGEFITRFPYGTPDRAVAAKLMQLMREAH